jgi:DNA topoisomerase VI subunit A
MYAALNDLKQTLGTTRASMKITTASGKGRVAGCLQIYVPSTGCWVDCESSTFSVPGDVNEIRFALICPTT